MTVSPQITPSESSLLEPILSHTRTIQARRLNNNTPLTDDQQEDEFLVGNCVQNAETLAAVLDYFLECEIVIVEGGLDYYNEPTPRTYEQARKDGTLHHWVEITTSNTTYYCNLYNEALENGCVHPPAGYLLTEELPPNYIAFN